MLTFVSSDARAQLIPRHTSRRERRPGARERHATQKQRLSPEPRAKHVPVSRPQSAQPQSSSFCMTSGLRYNQARKQEAVEEESQQQISHYKELSTTDAIRADMKSREKRRPASAPPHLPAWLLGLDINLDITSVDTIPPFETASTNNTTTDTYNERPKVTIVYDESYYADSEQSSTTPVHDTDDECKERERVERARSHVSISPEPKGSTERFSPTRTYGWEDISPRRYQGDKRVMSLQQGGIRSTPFQPKAKKYINQMISYHHMKVHDKKLKVAKPAVDTKMPSTFKIALERKRLVEQRLSRSWNRSYETSTPTNSSRDNSKSQNTS